MGRSLFFLFDRKHQICRLSPRSPITKSGDIASSLPLAKNKTPAAKTAGEQLKTQAYSSVPQFNSYGTVASLEQRLIRFFAV
jgi:hypothetical protein